MLGKARLFSVPAGHAIPRLIPDRSAQSLAANRSDLHRRCCKTSKSVIGILLFTREFAKSSDSSLDPEASHFHGPLGCGDERQLIGI